MIWKSCIFIFSILENVSCARWGSPIPVPVPPNVSEWVEYPSNDTDRELNANTKIWDEMTPSGKIALPFSFMAQFPSDGIVAIKSHMESLVSDLGCFEAVEIQVRLFGFYQFK